MESIVEQGRRLLIDVQDDKKFHVVNGATLKNIHELALLLETISNEEFMHHVNDERNDFARWIEGSVGDSELASRIERAASAEQIRAAILARIEEIEQQIAPAKPKKRARKKSAKQVEPAEEQFEHDEILKEIEAALAEAHEHFARPEPQATVQAQAPPAQAKEVKQGGFSLADFLAGIVFGLIFGVLSTYGVMTYLL